MNATVLKFDPRSDESIVDLRKKELLERWKANPFLLIEVLNEKDKAAEEELSDILKLNAIDNDDPLDAAYEYGKLIDNFKEKYADDIAWGEVNGLHSR